MFFQKRKLTESEKVSDQIQIKGFCHYNSKEGKMKTRFFFILSGKLCILKVVFYFILFKYIN